MMDDMHSPPAERIPLSKQTFNKRPASKGVLVIQYVTEAGTNRSYFRFIGPDSTVEGFAGNAEEADQRAREIASRLRVEIHDDIVHVTI